MIPLAFEVEFGLVTLGEKLVHSKREIVLVTGDYRDVVNCRMGGATEMQTWFRVSNAGIDERADFQLGKAAVSEVVAEEKAGAVSVL